MRDGSLQAAATLGKRAPSATRSARAPRRDEAPLSVAGGGSAVDCDSQVVLLLVQLRHRSSCSGPHEICAFGKIAEIRRMRSLQLWPAIAKQLEARTPGPFRACGSAAPRATGSRCRRLWSTSARQPVQIRPGDEPPRRRGSILRRRPKALLDLDAHRAREVLCSTRACPAASVAGPGGHAGLRSAASCAPRVAPGAGASSAVRSLGGSKLDRERQAVETLADCPNVVECGPVSARGRRPRPAPGRKEGHSIVRAERLYRKDVLTRDVEDSPTRHDDGQTAVPRRAASAATGSPPQTCSKLSSTSRNSRSVAQRGNRSLHRLPWLRRLRGHGRRPEARAPVRSGTRAPQRRCRRRRDHGNRRRGQERPCLPRAARPDEREQPDTGLLDESAQVAELPSRPTSGVVIAADEPAGAPFGSAAPARDRGAGSPARASAAPRLPRDPALREGRAVYRGERRGLGCRSAR